jgi:hypothetical protein
MSDSFKIACPMCGQHIECPNELYGQPVVCPSCHQQLVVTQTSPDSFAPCSPVSPVIAKKMEVTKPPLWNIFGLVKYHRERRSMQAALLRESRAKYVASILELIQRGEWALSLENVPLLRNEKVFWIETAILYEWKTVGRRYERSLLSSHGKRIVEKAESPVAEGRFIVTDQRLIFASDEQAFSVKAEKLVNIHLYPDGIRFAQDGRKTVRALKFPQKNGDVIQAILNQAFAGSTEGGVIASTPTLADYVAPVKKGPGHFSAATGCLFVFLAFFLIVCFYGGCAEIRRLQ